MWQMVQAWKVGLLHDSLKSYINELHVQLDDALASDELSTPEGAKHFVKHIANQVRAIEGAMGFVKTTTTQTTGPPLQKKP